MRESILFFVIVFLFISSLNAQPNIDQNDMPGPGDTIKLSVRNNVNGIDATITGANHLWDFSTYTTNYSRTDTFISVTASPLSYQAVFNDGWFDPDYQATVAQPQSDMSFFSQVEFTQVYNYFKATADNYFQVGQGSKVNGVPMPIKYNDRDLLYHFPMAMGDVDSSYYEYHINIPSLGYYGTSKKRINVVDGWGKVITPFDTFPAIRVFSTSYIVDTIHLDSLGFGFAVPRTEKEYKWLADTMGLPIYKITKTGGGMGGGPSNIEFIPTTPHPIDTTGISNLPYSLTFVSLYPNPADKNTWVTFALAKPTQIEIDISDITGKKITSIKNQGYTSGFHSVPVGNIVAGLPKGLYLVNIKSPDNSRALKLQVL